jgi:hypothetical protein
MSPARKPFLFIALTLVALLASACSALNATPTPSLQELQLTAQAAAAATLTAQAPKETPVPPTPIPPTPIPVIITEAPVLPPPVIIAPPSTGSGQVPTQAPIAQPIADTSGEPNCDGYIKDITEGPRAPVSVVNKKGSTIIFSYYLEPNDLDQCGSGSVNIESDEEGAWLNLPVGCYWLYAWVTTDKRDQSFSGYGCNPAGGTNWLVFPDRMEEALN